MASRAGGQADHRRPRRAAPTWSPQGTPAANSALPAGPIGFEQLWNVQPAGLRYTLGGGKVLSMTLGGAPVTATQEIKVAGGWSLIAGFDGRPRWEGCAASRRSLSSGAGTPGWRPRAGQWLRGAGIAFTEYVVSGAGVVVKRALGR
ncbi:hypothetical protein [Nonomuraea sp. NPDC049158]|uniref:hypothetical protein n=1 Tax=Nonomuraea sp. NPDC049158 TaxID=3155649 RepID=UPI0033BFE50F